MAETLLDLLVLSEMQGSEVKRWLAALASSPTGEIRIRQYTCDNLAAINLVSIPTYPHLINNVKEESLYYSRFVRILSERCGFSINTITRFTQQHGQILTVEHVEIPGKKLYYVQAAEMLLNRIIFANKLEEEGEGEGTEETDA